MAAVALALFLIFLLAAFGLRSLLQYRRTGSTGFHGLSGKPGSAEWWASVLFVLTAVAVGLASPLLQLGGVVSAINPLDTTALHVCGLLLAGAGIIGTLAAQHTMGTSWRVGVDHRATTQLVTTGMFALVRNPVFTTMTTACVGLTLLAPNPITVFGLGALVTALELQVRAVEEPYLLRTHGQTYLAYAARTGRFLPCIGRLSTTTASTQV